MLYLLCPLISAYGIDIRSSGLLMRLMLRLLVMAMRLTCGEGSTPNSGANSRARLYLNARR
jgi:hypothetical protein